MGARRIAIAPIAALVFWGLLAVGLGSARADTLDVPGNATAAAEAETYMDGLMAARMADARVPGAAAAVVLDGRTLFAKGYGYADLESRTPVDADRTLFRVGSISKLFVWTAVMQLVEQGKLSLAEDIDSYIDFSIPPTFTEPITLAALLSHTAGFEEKSAGLFLLDAALVPSLERYLKDGIPSRVFPAGAISAYSNYGSALAAYAVERVSRLPFHAYAEERILAPLGMTRSTFRQPLPPELGGALSGGYNYVDGEYLRGGFEYVAGYPAGSLSATASDMARFMTVHLQEGRYGTERIFSADTAARMRQRSYSADPRMAGMAHGFFEDVTAGRRLLYHCGDTLLFHSALFLLQKRKVGVFVTMNAAGGAEAAEATARAFLDRFFPAEGVENSGGEPGAPDFADRAAIYAGEYHEARSNFSSPEKLLSVVSPIIVSVEDGTGVSISQGSATRRYFEKEAGLLVNRERPSDALALRVEGGRTYLLTSGPNAYIKTPWYGSAKLHLLLFGGGAVLYLLTAIAWGRSFLAGLLKGSPRPLSARLLRGIAGVFAVTYLLFIVLFLELTGDADPAYGIPNLLFRTAPWPFGVTVALPAALWFAGLAMWPSAVYAWIRGVWTLRGRLHYSFLTLFSFVVLWALAYWKLLP